MTPDELRTLADEIEQAESGSVALDYQVWSAFGGPGNVPGDYTRSIDAAVGLMPEGAPATLNLYPNGTVELLCTRPDRDFIVTAQCAGQHATARAITAAALRLRAGREE